MRVGRRTNDSVVRAGNFVDARKGDRPSEGGNARLFFFNSFLGLELPLLFPISVRVYVNLDVALSGSTDGEGVPADIRRQTFIVNPLFRADELIATGMAHGCETDTEGKTY